MTIARVLLGQERDLLEPQDVPLYRIVWRAAAALGGLRAAVNDAHRRPDRDRGTAGNALVDTAGAVAELVVIRVVEQAGATGIGCTLLDTRGSVDDVDVRCVLDGLHLALEAKSHMIASNKRLFLINQRAHEHSRNRGASGYLPIVTSIGGGFARAGRLVPLDAVDEWGLFSHLGPHNDPALGLPLEIFARGYLSGGLPASIPSAATPEDLSQAFTAGRKALPDFIDQGLQINNIASGAAINILLSLIDNRHQ